MAGPPLGPSLMQGDFVDGVVRSVVAGLISQLKLEYQRELQRELQAAREGMPSQHHQPAAEPAAEAGGARGAAERPPAPGLRAAAAAGEAEPRPPQGGAAERVAAGAVGNLAVYTSQASVASKISTLREAAPERPEPPPSVPPAVEHAWSLAHEGEPERPEPPPSAPPAGQNPDRRREDADGGVRLHSGPVMPGVPEDTTSQEQAASVKCGKKMAFPRVTPGDETAARESATQRGNLLHGPGRSSSPATNGFGKMSTVSAQYDCVTSLCSTSTLPDHMGHLTLPRPEASETLSQMHRGSAVRASAKSFGFGRDPSYHRGSTGPRGSKERASQRPSASRPVERLSVEEEYALKLMREEEERKERAARNLFSHMERSRRSFFTNANGVIDERRRLAFSLVANPRFDFLLGVIIIVNAVTIGIETTFSRNGDSLPLWLQVLEYIFLVVYICELFFRVYALGLTEAFESNWIRLDVVLVGSGVLNLLINMTSADGDAGKITDNVNMLKMVRLFRLARVVRLLKQFRTLWMLVQGLMSCVMPMIWTSLIMLVVVYVFAVGGMELITADTHSPERYTEATSRFDSLYDAITFLIQCITLDSPHTVYRPITDHNPWLSIYFLIFLLIGPIALMNVITAIQVEALFKTAGEDYDAKKAWEKMKRKTMTPKLKSIFSALDADDSGEVDFDELVNAPEELKEQLRRIVDLDQMEEIFRMLDFDGSGAIDIDEFVDGIMRTQQDKPTELILLLKQSKAILDHLGTKDGGLQKGYMAERRRSSAGRSSSELEDIDVIATESGSWPRA